jgi:ATP-dependent helicase HepA
LNQQDFIPGQRWISNTELQMGLGTVLAVDARSVQIIFLATGETRTYARQSAPLTRLIFSVGDSVRSHDGWTLQVENIEEKAGLVTYIGTDENGQSRRLDEGNLDNFMQLSRPGDRLLNGQIDKPKWFELRHQTRLYQNLLSQSKLYGLIGARTSLLPHQLYIANEVAQRYAPRVLLADEVGLGKTIEAGLILHHQLLNERARRVLIVVPESLIHQWLVEMVRRFNLYFSLFDQQRCEAIQEGDETLNPFQSEQLVICSLEFLTQQEQYHQHAIDGEWDMLVVDEAHHLEWSPQYVSHEYACIEALALATKGVLLLTATPEQLGKAGHFARLRLLDPDRFPDFDQFIEEEKHYLPVTEAIENLLNGEELNKENYQVLMDTISEGDNQIHLETINNPAASESDKTKARNELIQHLLDRHGTGRVLFRNTRAAVKGFPQRQLHSYSLSLPNEYRDCLKLFQDAAISDAQLLLSPELLYESVRHENQPAWFELDPRINWLVTQLKALKPDKVLLITASAQTAIDIAQLLQQKHGIHAAVFHEELTILERDRAAAWFANQEQGCQLLVCSEIGSEGRNFQFAHHLILFDLPLNPDLLEQRIGRLDRIGQKDTIKIHAPYLDNSPQAIMKHWYHEGLNAFEQTCTAGQHVFSKLKNDLVEAMHQIEDGLEDLPAFIETTQSVYAEFSAALQQGRDRLLELSSFNEEKALKLVESAQRQSREHELNHFLDRIFDNYGIETDIHGPNSFVINPGDHVRISLPGLSEDGMTITYDRETALSNEDMQYITWEHPIAATAIDNVLSNELGNTAMVTIKHKAIPAGTLFMECFYLLESTSTRKVNTSRYLPSNNIRIVIDKDGKQFQEVLSHAVINQYQGRLNLETAMQVTRSHGSTLKNMLTKADKLAVQNTPSIIDEAKQHADQLLKHEIERLVALKELNPNVREDEIQHLQVLNDDIQERLNMTIAQLDAVRVIIAI